MAETDPGSCHCHSCWVTHTRRSKGQISTLVARVLLHHPVSGGRSKVATVQAEPEQEGRRTNDTNLSSISIRFMLCKCMMAKKMATRNMTMQHTLTLI